MTAELNVAITCAGRRVGLVRAFQEALQGCGLVHALDASPSAPALAAADRALIVPTLESPDYIPALLEFSTREDIRLLIAVHDLELPLLAAHRQSFAERGTCVLVPTPEVVDLCWDKWQCQTWLRSGGMMCPRNYLHEDDALRAVDSGAIGFPLVVKPRWGVGSIGLESAGNADELRMVSALDRARLASSVLAAKSLSDPMHSLVIEERIDGTHYCLDVVNDLSGDYVTCWPKEKLRMRAGTADRVRFVDDAALRDVGQVLSSLVRQPGPMDVDVIRTPEHDYIIDVNPRIGGTYPFSHAAGADLPRTLLAWVSGHEADPDWLRVRNGATFSFVETVIECG